MFTNAEKNEVRRLLAHCLANPVRRAAREARRTYILELISASYRGEDVDREAQDWLNRLNELCDPHAEVEDIARWYQIEKARLEKLTNR
jgi:hypothetical protein